MRYLLKKINKGSLAAFLVNPCDKVAYFNQFVLQKYSRGISTDDLIAIHKTDNIIKVIGGVDYDKKEIVIADKYLPLLSQLNDYTFKSFKDLQIKANDIILEKLEEMRTIRRNEVEASALYNVAYNRNRLLLLKPMIYSLIGTTKCCFSDLSSVDIKIADFLSEATNKDLLDFNNGKLLTINELVDDIVYEYHFLFTFFILPKLTKESQEYFDNKVFDKREKRLIDFLEKTKACGAKKFDAKVDKYGKMSLLNEVSFHGKLNSANTLGLEIDFEKIQSLKYRETIIYERDDS